MGATHHSLLKTPWRNAAPGRSSIAFIHYNHEFGGITRQLFGTVGVNDGIEFFALSLDPLRGIDSGVVTNSHPNRGSLELLFEELLSDFRFRTPWRDFEGSVRHVVTDLRLHLGRAGQHRQVQRVEVIRPVFYQMSRAYVVRRINSLVPSLLVRRSQTPKGSDSVSLIGV